MSTSRGSTWEYAGTSRTSSNVKPSPKNFLDWGIFACGALMIDAMCKDRGAEKYAPKVFLCHELDSLCYKNFPTQVGRKLFKKNYDATQTNCILFSAHIFICPQCH